MQISLIDWDPLRAERPQRSPEGQARRSRIVRIGKSAAEPREPGNVQRPSRKGVGDKYPRNARHLYTKGADGHMVLSAIRKAQQSMPKKCSVRGCDRPHRAYGMCRVHYARWYRTGSTKRTQRDYDDGRPIFEHAFEKLMTKVAKRSNGCWVFTEAPRSGGYGAVIIHRGDAFGSFKWAAHRLTYERFNGPIPAGMLVCHSCDNRLCCNPKHLFLGTHKDNLADMVAKGRSLYGERANNVSLTEAQVVECYKLRNEGMTYREIGEKFGVTYGCIHMVCAGRNWQRTHRRHRRNAPSVKTRSTPKRG